MAQKKKEVRPLTPVIEVQGSTNAQLVSSTEKRFPHISVKMGDKTFVFLDNKERQGDTYDELRALVYAAIKALNSAGSREGDGAILYIHENINHPQVARLLKNDVELVYTIGSDRTGVAGYRVPGPAIKAVVEALAPIIENSVKEFGYPRPQARGKKEVEAENIEVDFAW